MVTAKGKESEVAARAWPPARTTTSIKPFDAEGLVTARMRAVQRRGPFREIAPRPRASSAMDS